MRASSIPVLGRQRASGIYRLGMADTLTELTHLLDRLVREHVALAVADLPVSPGTPEPEDDWLVSVPEAAQRLAVSRSTIYALMSAGQLPHVKVGAKTGISHGDLRAFVDRNRSTGPRSRQGQDA